MKILEPEKLENGEPFLVDFTDDEIICLKGFADKFIKKNPDHDFFGKETFSKEEEEELISIGFIEMLKEYIEKHEK